ncbi:hypothetical protein [Parvicella tangerina]|uniref:hypothetical protein n=1 Tax=Parvicella tangerina TaxID=2829795 RepID=UPI00215C2F08|nr:hypothetical protein [Parvicella tangerina]
MEYSHLINVSDSTNKVKIKSIKSLWFEDTLQAYRDVNDLFAAPFEREIHNEGWNFFVTDDSVYGIWVNNYTMHGTYSHDRDNPPSLQMLYEIHSYGGDGYGESYCYELKDITAITLKNRLKPWMRTVAWIGLTSSLVISPLASYSFRTREMNSTRYNKWMLFSLSGMTTFFTINLFLKNKTYRIKPVYDGQECWKFTVDK